MWLSRQLDRAPVPVRRVIRDEMCVVNERLRQVRRPRDLRRLLKDPTLVADLSEPLTPALDRLLALVVNGAAPLPPGLATLGGTATAVIGATAESVMEVAAVLGIEVPPVAATVAGSALSIGIAVQLVEFYLTVSMAWTELSKADRADVIALRRVIMATYLGADGPTGGDIPALGFDRIARALLKRAVPSFIPLAGIPLAGRAAHQAQKRAQAAVAAEIAGRSIGASRHEAE